MSLSKKFTRPHLNQEKLGMVVQPVILAMWKAQIEESASRHKNETLSQEGLQSDSSGGAPP
jgi:hypothetical protein